MLQVRSWVMTSPNPPVPWTGGKRDLQLPGVPVAPGLHPYPQELTRKRERPPGVQASAPLLLGGGPDGRNLPKRDFFQQFSAATFPLSLEWQPGHKTHLH